MLCEQNLVSQVLINQFYTDESCPRRLWYAEFVHSRGKVWQWISIAQGLISMHKAKPWDEKNAFASGKYSTCTNMFRRQLLLVLDCDLYLWLFVQKQKKEGEAGEDWVRGLAGTAPKWRWPNSACLPKLWAVNGKNWLQCQVWGYRT